LILHYENNLQFTGGGNGPYYSLFTNSDYSLHFILGILAHPIFEAMVKAGASEFRGSYFSHGKQFIEKLPIRKIDFKNAIEKRLYNEVVRTVKKLIETKAIYENYLSVKKKILQRKMNFLFDSLIEQVNSLYGISEIEMNAVLSDDMLNDKIFENE
jgi:hypothetical protein